MMTRAMGDAHMKDPDCFGSALHRVGTSLVGLPTLLHYDMCAETDVALVLVTDGVTGNVPIGRFAEAFGRRSDCVQNAAEQIVYMSVQETMRRSNLTCEQLHSLTRGVARRSITDDTTCLVVFFDQAPLLMQ